MRKGKPVSHRTTFTDYFDSLDVAGHALVHSNGGAAKLAPLVGIQPGTLCNKANPQQEHDFTVRELVRLTAVTDDYCLLDAIETILGRVGVKVGEYSGSSDIELLDAWANVQAEEGETATAIRDALRDGRIDADELANIKREIFEDFSARLELLARLEGIAE